jgi:hypothetical protein
VWFKFGVELELGELRSKGGGDWGDWGDWGVWFRGWEGRRKRGNRLFLLASFDILYACGVEEEMLKGGMD